KLFLRQADARHPRPGLSEEVRQAAPAAADLEQGLRRADPLGQARPLAPLRRLEVVALAPDGRGIAHRRVEPGGVEIVAEIVMRVDVALRTFGRVAVHPVRQPRGPAERPARTTGV